MTLVLRNKVVVAAFERCPFLNYTDQFFFFKLTQSIIEKIPSKKYYYNRTKKGKTMQGLDEGTECPPSLKSLLYSETTQIFSGTSSGYDGALRPAIKWYRIRGLSLLCLHMDEQHSSISIVSFFTLK